MDRSITHEFRVTRLWLPVVACVLLIWRPVRQATDHRPVRVIALAKPIYLVMCVKHVSTTSLLFAPQGCPIPYYAWNKTAIRAKFWKQFHSHQLQMNWIEFKLHQKTNIRCVHCKFCCGVRTQRCRLGVLTSDFGNHSMIKICPESDHPIHKKCKL